MLHLQYFNLFFFIFGSGFSHSNYEGLSSFWQRKRGTRGESSRCAIIASLSAFLLSPFMSVLLFPRALDVSLCFHDLFIDSLLCLNFQLAPLKQEKYQAFSKTFLKSHS